MTVLYPNLCYSKVCYNEVEQYHQKLSFFQSGLALFKQEAYLRKTAQSFFTAEERI